MTDQVAGVGDSGLSRIMNGQVSELALTPSLGLAVDPACGGSCVDVLA